jgi:hypothetical protein
MGSPVLRSATLGMFAIPFLATLAGSTVAQLRQPTTAASGATLSAPIEQAADAAVPPQQAEKPSSPSQAHEKPAVFRIKYVTGDSVYLAAGRNAGLEEGMRLTAVKPPPDGDLGNGLRFRGQEHIAELQVVSVADTSSVCAILRSAGEVRVGLVAFLSVESVQNRRATDNADESDQYSTTVGFTYGDPLDDEVREVQEKQILQESPVGRLRGRVGFDFGDTQESGGFSSRQVGMLINADVTFIGGTYWNFTGYWRGNLNSSNSQNPGTQPTTLNDLINRTYQLVFTYDSPYSPVRIGMGRLYLPWAPSLSTIDGAYFARKLSRNVTGGFFAGSTPNPTSWSYYPDQHIAGAFINYTAGDYDRLRLFTTAGIAMTSIQWRVMRQFAFFENSFSWKRYVTFFNSLQADEARVSPLPGGGSNPTGISQSYTSLHFQPFARLSFGLNHNYFRNLPTFDPRLIVTGLLDNYLFQGVSGDVRVELPKHITLYTSLGKSSVSSDQKSSLNEGFGVGFANIGKTGLNADAHYSKFNSAFGSGQYESFSLSRSVNESLRVQLIGGKQTLLSSLSSNNNSTFVNAEADWNVGPRYFMETNFGWYNGTTLNYKQWSTVIGYRFGSFRK